MYYMDMFCLLASFADVTRIYGNSQKSVHVKQAFGQGQVKRKPVDALRLLSVEVTAVGLLTVAAIPLHLGEIYLSWDNHV